MSHVRQQIRDVAVTNLTGLTTTGTNVFKSRAYPLQDEEIPGLCVYTNTETNDEDTGKFDTFDNREMVLQVDGYDKIVAGIEDSLDDIAVEVETAIMADPKFGGVAKFTDYLGFTTENSIDGEQPIGRISIIFRVTYFVNTGAPETAI
jgi:hypothetical protein